MRSKPLPYASHWIDDDDIAAVAAVLRSEWLTTGPAVERLERAMCDVTGAAHAVAVSSGTAALHCAVAALGVRPGDEVIVPAMTFVATANCVAFRGATPVFADVDADTLLIDPQHAQDLITSRTKAVIAVDYAGQPCDYDALNAMCDRHGLSLVDDAAHSLGARDRGIAVGTLAALTTFSFHPAKHITSGEGGVVTTNDARLATHMRQFRNHGITSDARQREQAGAWAYAMEELGYNYRLSDIHSALAAHQLRKLPRWLARRRELASRYDRALYDVPGVRPLAVRRHVEHAYHLYVVQLDPAMAEQDRAAVVSALRRERIGANVHYLPVHLHEFYRRRYGTHAGLCPVAEAAAERVITLPLFPRMSDDDLDDVVDALRRAVVEVGAGR